MSENKNDNLQTEMENLVATFQSEYDKNAAAADHPLIQELDDIVEDEEEEEADAPVGPDKKKAKKKKEKKKASSIIGSIISVLLVIALLVTTAAVSFYASVFTDLDSYYYCLQCAEKTENAAQKIEYYREGLSYLENETKQMDPVPSFYLTEMQTAHELIAVSTVETEGYAAAMKYMHENLTEEQIAAPCSPAFKSFLKIADVFNTLAANCIETVEGAGADADFTALAATYTDNEVLAADIAAILKNTADAVAAEKTADVDAATDAYKLAIDGLAEYSTASQVLTEHYVICLAQTDGYAAALSYAYENLTEEEMAAPVFADFATFAGVKDILAGLSETIYAELTGMIGESSEAPTDFSDMIAALNAPAYVHKEIETLYANVANGITKVNAGAYASAVELLSAAADSFKGYDCPSAAVTESVVIATAYANGYAAALDYAKKNITAEDYTPATEEYVAFLAANVVFSTLDSAQYDAVAANVATFTDADSADIDMSGVVADLGIHECLHADAQAILTNLARAAICETNGDNDDALDYYETIAENFAAIGISPVFTFEKIAVLLSKTEDLHEAYVFVSENADILTPDVEREALTEDFAALMTTLDGAFSVDKVGAFIDNAKDALEAADYAEVDVADIVSASGIDTAVAGFYEAYYAPLKEALQAEQDKNLTLAFTKYEALATLLADDGVALPDALIKGIINVAYKSGDIQSAVTYLNNYVDVDALEDGEFKTVCRTVQQIDIAMQAGSNILQQAYYAGYYGTMPTRDELTAQFDALLTEESTAIDEAFNYYYRYVCEVYFFAEDADSEAKQREYLEKVQQLIPEQIFVYGYYMMEYAIGDGDLAAAKEIAEKILSVNAYDDVALSLMAKIARVEGDTDAAAAYAEKGIAYENSSYECERQHIINCMLSGNYADAYTSVIALYDRGLATMLECETVIAYAALYTDANADQKAKLDSIVSYINTDLYSAYGYTFSESTNALVAGTKTAADVFLAEPYDLW